MPRDQYSDQKNILTDFFEFILQALPRVREWKLSTHTHSAGKMHDELDSAMVQSETSAGRIFCEQTDMNQYHSFSC